MTIPDRNARVRAAARPEAGPVVWQIERATWNSMQIVTLLASGWEPFAVQGELIYLRRQTSAGLN